MPSCAWTCVSALLLSVVCGLMLVVLVTAAVALAINVIGAAVLLDPASVVTCLVWLLAAVDSVSVGCCKGLEGRVACFWRFEAVPLVWASVLARAGSAVCVLSHSFIAALIRLFTSSATLFCGVSGFLAGALLGTVTCATFWNGVVIPGDQWIPDPAPGHAMTLPAFSDGFFRPPQATGTCPNCSGP